MPLDPQAQALLDQLAETGMPPFEHMSVPQARQAAWAFADLQGPAPEIASVQHRFIPGPKGPTTAARTATSETARPDGDVSRLFKH